MKYMLVVATLMGVNSMQGVSEELQPDYFFGISLSDTNSLAKPHGTEVKAKYAPAVFVGLNYTFDVSPDWEVDWSHSLHFTQGSIALLDNPEAPYTNMTNVGLWSQAKLKYQGLFDEVSPFVQAGVGLVNVDYSLDGKSNNEWNTGTNFQAGFEFNLASDSSFSISVGKHHYDKF